MTLPVVKLLGAALMLTWDRRYSLLRALWLPLALGIALSVAEKRWGPNSPQDSGAVFWIAPVFVLTVMLAVRSYRVFLRGSDPEQQLLPLSWSIRETRFLLAMMAVSFSFALVAFLFGGLLGLLWPDAHRYAGEPFAVLIFLPAAYLASRLLLAFPALAVEDGESTQKALQRAWEVSRHNGMRILFLCVVAPAFIAWLLALLGSSTLPGTDVVSAVLVWLLLPVELSIVAMVYATLNKAVTNVTT